MTANLAPRPGVIWICGFSAAGKTTVSRKVVRLLRRRQVSAVLLDGDELRGIYGNRWGYERDARLELGFVNHRLAAYLASQGHTVVIAAGGMYRKVHDWVKENVSGAISVYLHVSEDERLRRDRETKKIYSQLKNTGSLFDEIEPDLVIENFGDVTSDVAAAKIVDFYFQDRPDKSKEARLAYWEGYYKRNELDVPSSFARSLLSRLPDGARLVDIGCGDGADIEILAPKTSFIIGLDPAASAIAKTKSRFVASGLTAELVHGYVDKLDHCNANSVVCRSVLDAVTPNDERDILQGAARALGATGNVFIECLSIHDASLRHGEIIGPSERLGDRYIRYIDPQSLVDNLVAAGFAIKTIGDAEIQIGDRTCKVIRAHAQKGLS
jgi:SAM-dependent methyltransferase/gluconate kinase